MLSYFVAGLFAMMATATFANNMQTVAADSVQSRSPAPRVTTESNINASKHIREVTYSADKIYKIVASQGYTTAIQLGAEEKIISVNVGDSSAWLVNVQNNVINLKPIVDNPTTNMNVMSDRGGYQFLLTAIPSQRDVAGQLVRQPDEHALFVLRFRYKENAPSAQTEKLGSMPLRMNYRYTARGNTSVAPISVYDNGRFTYFDFSHRQNIPAIFSVDLKGKESLVNYHLQSKYVVVESIGRQFTLRDGDKVATVFNEANDE